MVFLLAGCGNGNPSSTDNPDSTKPEINDQTDTADDLEEGWNGLYKSDSKYYIMIYTKDDENIAFNVIIKDDNMEMYPIQWDSIPIKDKNTIEYSTEFFDDIITLNITRNGNTINVNASDTDADSEWNNISGTYTKYKNVSSGDVSEFTL